MRPAVCVLFLGLITGLNAQTISGTITGTVTDPAGLAVVGADVTLIQAATGVERKTQTVAAGEVVFAAVEPGTYNLSVAVTGF